MNPIEKYRTAAVATKGVDDQLVFIFDEVYKMLMTAQKAIRNKEYELKYKTLLKILEVFYSLKGDIDPKADTNAQEKVNKFYDITVARIEDINMSESSSHQLQPIIDGIREVRTLLKNKA